LPRSMACFWLWIPIDSGVIFSFIGPV
jgi:hypothetical protein